MNSIIEFRNVKKVYESNNKIALENITLQLREGELLNLIGHNGSGKSTLLNLVSRSIEKTEGAINYFDTDIGLYSRLEWNLIIGKVYQNPLTGLIPNFTVLQNLVLFSLKNHNLSLFRSIYNKKYANKIVGEFETLKNESKIEFDFHLHNKVRELSGGNQQLVSLLTLFFQKPIILLLDEPTASLDENNTDNFLRFLSYWIDRERISAIMVSHHEKFAFPKYSRIVLLEDGKIHRIFSAYEEYLMFKESTKRS